MPHIHTVVIHSSRSAEAAIARRIGRQNICEFAKNAVDIPSSDTSTRSSGILRAADRTLVAYDEIYAQLRMAGIELLNTPKASNAVSEFREHFTYIKEATFASCIIPREEPYDKMFDHLRKAGLKAPLFVKSNIKSLKELSIIRNATLDEFSGLAKLYSEKHPTYSYLIVRQIEELVKASDGNVLEWRAFCHRDFIFYFEGPDIEEFTVYRQRAYQFATKWAGVLFEATGAGVFCVDVSFKQSDSSPVIVEVKDLQFASAKVVEYLYKRFP